VRVLADTNILIPLEDTSPLFDKATADFARLTATHGWKVMVHPASFEDVQRDKDAVRRETVLSKLAKYPRLEKTAPPPPEFLKALDTSPSEQDTCDNRLLYAVAANAVDLLVTEDRGIHAKAKRVGLNERVYYVTQCLALIDHLHGERKRTPPAVQRVPISCCWSRPKPVMRAMAPNRQTVSPDGVGRRASRSAGFTARDRN
jgi:hypothetical protein